MVMPRSSIIDHIQVINCKSKRKLYNLPPTWTAIGMDKSSFGLSRGTRRQHRGAAAGRSATRVRLSGTEHIRCRLHPCTLRNAVDDDPGAVASQAGQRDMTRNSSKSGRDRGQERSACSTPAAYVQSSTQNGNKDCSGRPRCGYRSINRSTGNRTTGNRSTGRPTSRRGCPR
jgi:hypothetical protein